MSDVILIADDRPEIRRLIRRILEPRYHIIEAGDGQEALYKLDAFAPVISILDVEMPVLTGIEVCRRVRAHRSSASMGLILMTASGTEDEMSARAAGADGFLAKPFSPRHLIALVEQLLLREATALGAEDSQKQG